MIRIIPILAAALFSCSALASNEIVVGAFSQGDLTGWETEVFNAETRYHFEDTAEGTVLKSEANTSASGLFKKLTIDLSQTPCLRWRWKVDRALEGLDETTKAGDDYAARVYLVVSTGPFFWQTHAISYVWSGSRPIDTFWPNAYTDKATMIAMQSGNSRAGEWVQETRNIRADVERFVGADIKMAHAVALMTDTDDSALTATAYYGDIALTACR